MLYYIVSTIVGVVGFILYIWPQLISNHLYHHILKFIR